MNDLERSAAIRAIEMRVRELRDQVQNGNEEVSRLLINKWELQSDRSGDAMRALVESGAGGSFDFHKFIEGQ